MARKREMRVGRLVFTVYSFVVTSIAGLVFAATAGSFLPPAIPASAWYELFYSCEALTLLLLLGLCWFVQTGVKNSHYREAGPLVSWVTTIFVTAHAGSTLGPLLWPI